MSRWALGLEYDGATFSGWQKQPDPTRTVQGELEKSLALIACHPVNTVCAGRTDAKVHATQQIVHFDCKPSRPSSAWVRGCNGLLPSGIRIHWAQPVADTFHARFDAKARRYRYIIHNLPYEPAILRQGLAWYRQPLKADHMHEAAQHLCGEHDFSSFRASGCQFRTPIRCVETIMVFRHGLYIVVDITANAFLLNMVRNIVGSLYLVGGGKKKSAWIAELLNAKDRTIGGDTAEPQGLYLVGVRYASKWGVPETIPGPTWLNTVS